MIVMTLIEQIAQGENATLEFKEARPKDALKFVKTVVAFANGRGGRILFGVEDGTGRVVGVDHATVQREMDVVADTIANVCTPRINPKLMLANVDGKSVIVVDIPQGDSTPYYVRKLGLRKGVFQRIGATTREVEEHTLKDLILGGENLSFDKQIVKEVKVGKREIAAACRLMTACARKNCEDKSQTLDVRAMTETRLESMGLLVDSDGEKKATYALALIAGWTIPSLMVPRIRCGVFKGNDKSGDFLDHADYEGPLADQIENAFQFVKRNLRVGAVYVDENTAHKDVYELPLVSIREAICNAVFHRNYLEPANVYVALYDDRLEINSPGGLLRDITIEDVKAGYSKVRNRGIADALVYMHEVENWGGGVARYYVRCAEMGIREPAVEEVNGSFRVTFYRPSGVNGMLIGRRGAQSGAQSGVQSGAQSGDQSEGNKNGVQLSEKILNVLQMEPKRSLVSLASSLGVSPKTVKQYVARLKDKGGLRRIGGTRGHWEVAK